MAGSGPSTVAPFKFTAKINELTFNLGPDQATAEERERMKRTVAAARD